MADGTDPGEGARREFERLTAMSNRMAEVTGSKRIKTLDENWCKLQATEKIRNAALDQATTGAQAHLEANRVSLDRMADVQRTIAHAKQAQEDARIDREQATVDTLGAVVDELRASVTRERAIIVIGVLAILTAIAVAVFA